MRSGPLGWRRLLAYSVGKAIDRGKAATAYLDFLFSPPGQEMIAAHAFRPRNEVILRKLASRFPAIKTFSVGQALVGWSEVQAKHSLTVRSTTRSS
jgi:sulfate/thiosulfate transport system substrate-binding protein